MSFSSSPSVRKGGGKGGKTKLVFPSEDGSSVVDLRQDDKCRDVPKTLSAFRWWKVGRGNPLVVPCKADELP